MVIKYRYCRDLRKRGDGSTKAMRSEPESEKKELKLSLKKLEKSSKKV